MKEYTEIESEFIRQELEKHNKRLSRLWLQAIQKRKLRREGKLERSVSAGRHRISGTGTITLERNFVGTGRAIEIQHHRMKKGLRGMRAEAREVAWGIKGRRNRIKNTNWYTRNVFGAQNALINKLMWGLTDFRAKLIKEQLKSDTIKAGI